MDEFVVGGGGDSWVFAGRSTTEPHFGVSNAGAKVEDDADKAVEGHAETLVGSEVRFK